MALTLTPWDPMVHFTTPDQQAAYIEAAFEEGDRAAIAMAIANVARARGVALAFDDTQAAPELPTLTDALKTLGLKLQVVAAE